MFEIGAFKPDSKTIKAVCCGLKTVIVRFVIILVLCSAQNQYECRRRGGRGGEGRLADDVVPTANAADIELMDSASQVQCEAIQISLCSDMAYKSTRMPNFFGDTNQIEVAARAQYYQRLAMSKCSAHVRTYICELLTPVCLEQSQEAMKRFEIYPCRSFCRRVHYDCKEFLVNLNQQLYNEVYSNAILAGFACEKLPFESNGGNGTNHGPCHEAPDQAGQQQQQASKPGYGPYKPSLDANVPPFITDTSPLDPSLIKPPAGSNNSSSMFEPPEEDVQIARPNQKINYEKPAGSIQSQNQAADNQAAPDRTKAQQQQQPNFFEQIYSIGHNFAIILARYSNAIGIALVLVLLIALFSERLRRLKFYLRLSPSSSTKSSSTNSTSSHHALHPNHHKHQRQFKLDHQQYPVGGLQHTAPLGKQSLNQLQVSPSASSRSLVLIAGKNRQPPSHQLVDEPVHNGVGPSQKLLFGMQHQRTLINANGTLERQYNNRYHQLVMQSAASPKTFMSASDKQQLFNTLDSHSSHSNQYDYIQVASEQSAGSIAKADHEQQQQQQQLIMRARQQQQQQRLYSNILLSSPSHQVLLFDDPQQQQHQAAFSQSRPSLQQQPARQAGQLGLQMASASNLSPYDSPTSCPPGPEARHQRSFQRRPSNNNSSSSRTTTTTTNNNNTKAGLLDGQQRAAQVAFASPTRAAYAASSASSRSNSSSSSYSALSPASSSMAPPLPPPQLVHAAARTNPRRPL